jgi:elongation factor Tu
VIGYNRTGKGRVTGIEMFHKILEEANAGDQMGILARGIKKDDVRRGMCVVKPGTVKQCDNFRAQVGDIFKLYRTALLSPSTTY